MKEEINSSALRDRDVEDELGQQRDRPGSMADDDVGRICGHDFDGWTGVEEASIVPARVRG
jgi:hypothetical protein